MGAVMQSNAIFLTISNGQICKKVLQPTAISKERMNKNGATVHEEYYKGWKGQITAIAIREHQEYGKFWNITLTDNEGDAVLQMKYSSGYAGAFLKILPNIDLSGDVVITPKLTIEGQKKKTSLFVTQHGQPVKWFYTKDNPNGLPQLQKRKLKGQDVWDDTDMMEFLEKMVNTEIIPKLPKGRTAGTAIAIEEIEAEEVGSDDEAPF
jgi:hypothetical protein